MNILMFSVFDKQVKAYMAVFPARAVGEAMRMVSNSMKDGNSQLSRDPQDYSLYHMFNYDDVTGAISQDQDMPRLVVHLGELEKERGG